ncbi:MAG: tryptophan 7-halogenase [Fimbriimonadaceae bacterium]|jgi:flavin-dependent dehydrogenase|nr:tryptophan 7-halogenase [Fimbriimonadaceae bacterium]
MNSEVDVAIIGGGPAGSTAASILLKYAPDLKVTIIEREAFPRDHVGESQLPPISTILNEMGCWEKVEAAGFPIKIGATYRWGQTKDLWDFEFIPGAKFQDQERPAPYQGQRTQTAFQVDRAIYDTILLEHAASLGANVLQPRKVVDIWKEQDRVVKLTLDDGKTIEAKHYIDASGHAGILRRAMGVEVEAPTKLRNIALWSYWENADWAVEIGVGGTRVQVLSLGYGWIWFIPLGPTKTSIGLIVPASYYKECGKTTEELYQEALSSDPIVSQLTRNAKQVAPISTTKDWSFLADRLTGENWFLAGESAGFADPILAAGMTLAHSQARETAYSILSIEFGKLDPDWVKSSYCRANRQRIRQHIRFADFWYSANSHFTELKEHCSDIAREAGLELEADKAFQWLGTGGFIHDQVDYPTVATFPLGTIKHLAQALTADRANWKSNSFTRFKLNLEGAERTHLPVYREGRIYKVPCLQRQGKTLPQAGIFRAVIIALDQGTTAPEVMQGIYRYYAENREYSSPTEGAYHAVQALELMVQDGWITGSYDPSIPPIGLAVATEDAFIHPNRDNVVKDQALTSL